MQGNFLKFEFQASIFTYASTSGMKSLVRYLGIQANSYFAVA